LQIPAENQPDLLLGVTRPRLAWQVTGPSVSPSDPNWKTGRIHLENTGFGALFVVVLPAVELTRADGEVPPKGKLQLPLWQDPVELSSLDVVGVSEELDGDTLNLTFAHVQAIPETLGVRWILYVDLDAEGETGQSLHGLGADRRLVVTRDTVVVEEWSGGQWSAIAGEGKVAIMGRRAEVRVPNSLVGVAHVTSVPFYLEAQLEFSDGFAVFDRVPDRGPWRPHLLVAAPSALEFSQGSFFLGTHQSTEVEFQFDARVWGSRDVRFLLLSWDPVEPSVPVPVHFPTGVVSSGETPADWSLERPYPNPFRTVLDVRVRAARGKPFVLRVYDLRGRVVRVLHNGPSARRGERFLWDGTDERGNRLPSGVYLIQLRTADGFARMRKVLLLR